MSLSADSALESRAVSQATSASMAAVKLAATNDRIMRLSPDTSFLQGLAAQVAQRSVDVIRGHLLALGARRGFGELRIDVRLVGHARRQFRISLLDRGV